MANTAHLVVAADGEASQLIIRDDEMLQRERAGYCGRFVRGLRPTPP